jgi:hypothetical protein
MGILTVLMRMEAIKFNSTGRDKQRRIPFYIPRRAQESNSLVTDFRIRHLAIILVKPYDLFAGSPDGVLTSRARQIQADYRGLSIGGLVSTRGLHFSCSMASRWGLTMLLFDPDFLRHFLYLLLIDTPQNAETSSTFAAKYCTLVPPSAFYLQKWSTCLISSRLITVTPPWRTSHALFITLYS